MQKNVTFVVQTGEHSKREELVTFLSDIASVSEKLNVEERDTNGELRSAISFLLEADGEDTGIRFSGIPGGHEFNSLVLAMLHAHHFTYLTKVLSKMSTLQFLQERTRLKYSVLY